MSYLYLVRLSETAHGTHGVFLNASYIPVAYALEPCWRDNFRNESCIPPGDYPLSLHSSVKFKKALLVDKVEGRSSILIHGGNTLKDTSGCILPGLRYHAPRLFDSLEALDVLLDLYNNGARALRLIHHNRGGSHVLAR